MAINFPASPSVNDTHIDTTTGDVWKCTGVSPVRWAKVQSISVDSYSASGIIGHDISTTSSVVTCSTAMPFDDTIPQNTEGTEVITLTYTPKLPNSKLFIHAKVQLYSGNAQATGVALFKDSDASAIAVNAQSNADALINALDLHHVYQCTSTDSVTFKIRVGGASGTQYVNANGSGTRIYGGTSNTFLEVQEMNFASATKMIGFAAESTTDQTVSDGVATKVQCNTELYDPFGFYDNTTNYRFQPTIAGWYHIEAMVDIDNAGSLTTGLCYIYKNGSVELWGTSNVIAGQSTVNTTVSGLQYCNGSTDYLELYAYTIGTSTRYFRGSGKTRFAAYLVGTN